MIFAKPFINFGFKEEKKIVWRVMIGLEGTFN